MNTSMWWTQVCDGYLYVMDTCMWVIPVCDEHIHMWWIHVLICDVHKCWTYNVMNKLYMWWILVCDKQKYVINTCEDHRNDEHTQL